MKKHYLALMPIFLLIGRINTGPVKIFDENILRGKKMIAEGVEKWDDRIMLEARGLFENSLAKGDLQWLAHHYIGYSDFRLSIFYRYQNNPDKQLKYISDGIDHLYSSLNLNEEFVESHALLALLLGQMALMDSSQRAGYGMEAQTAISDARKLGDKNPRVALISGIIYAYTPEQFGGSKAKAFAEFKRAISLFETHKTENEMLPDWGHSEALAWLARLYLESKQFELAKQSLESALKINPNDRMALQLKQRISVISKQ